MQYALPVVDDTLVWDAWLAVYRVPAISVAIELDIFESLHAEPDSAAGLAARRSYNERGLQALLPFLAELGFLESRAGVYQLTEAGKQYMLKQSPFYWGAVFSSVGLTMAPHQLLLETINNERANAQKNRPVDGWESGHVDEVMAKRVTAYMHSHSMAAAIGMTHTCDFSNLHKVLDVGGGSGCFAIALAQHSKELSCTVMELASICELARDYIADAGVSEQVDTITIDMFRQDWPRGYDGHFFSNIFHDWSPETCLALARSSYAALEPGGEIILHEMLLSDSGNSPRHALAFSLLMAMGTMGQQFSFPQLKQLLESAGFINVTSQSSYGYYSLVRGARPR